MEHWQPSETAQAVEPPSDVWSAWLNRAPLHDVTPSPPPPRHWTGMVVVSGLIAFWAGVGALGWSLLA